MRHGNNSSRRHHRGGRSGGGHGGGNHSGHSHNSGGGNNGGRRFNPRIQTFDSNGPEVRIRGNAFQVNEKYLSLARDAAAAGDRVLAESYLQHAEHYQRMLNEAAIEFGDQPPQQQQGYNNNNAQNDMASSEQPEMGGQPMNGQEILTQPESPQSGNEQIPQQQAESARPQRPQRPQHHRRPVAQAQPAAADAPQPDTEAEIA